MDPITININLNLSDEHVSQICGAIGCLAQIIDLASRTAGTPFPAQMNMTQHGANSTQVAQVANFSKGDTFDPEIARDADKPGFTPPGADPDEPPEAVQDETEPTRTEAELRNKVIELTHKGLQKEAAALVHKYAEKVSAVPESARNALYRELLKLEANSGTDTE